MIRPVYNWPESVCPKSMVLSVLQTVQPGFVSRAEFLNPIAIPGGRVKLSMEFDTMIKPGSELASSWLMSNLAGNLFMVDIDHTKQVASKGDMGLASSAYSQGIPFDENGDVFFDDNTGFAFEPFLSVTGGGLEGENQITVDETAYPNVLKHGLFVNIGKTTYHIKDVERSGTSVKITVQPPLRRDITASDRLWLRPRMLCQAINPDNFTSMFRRGKFVSPGSIDFMEVIDEHLL